MTDIQRLWYMLTLADVRTVVRNIFVIDYLEMEYVTVEYPDGWTLREIGVKEYILQRSSPLMVCKKCINHSGIQLRNELKQ